MVPATRGLMRRPLLAIVAATDAICSGVARSVFWPIAAEPTAIASFISSASGIVEIFAAGMSGCSKKPNFLAIATMRLAPTLAPSGPKTLLQDFANEMVSEPPQAESPALRSFAPDNVAKDFAG